MPGARNFYRQRRSQVIGFVAMRAPARYTAHFKGGTNGGHFGVEIVGHRCASGFVIR
ncbi:hypothetical protein D3C81_1948800 [compost metagenome]